MSPRQLWTVLLCSVVVLPACMSSDEDDDDSADAGVDAEVIECDETGEGYWDSNWAFAECQVLALTNQRRAEGADCANVDAPGTHYMPPVGPLHMHAILRRVARAHSQDMGERNFFDHYNPDGLSPFDRMQAAGFTGTAMGENIAAGYVSPSAVVDGWMTSLHGHCDNMMLPDYTVIGIGYAVVPGSDYTQYWTQDFGGGL